MRGEGLFEFQVLVEINCHANACGWVPRYLASPVTGDLSSYSPLSVKLYGLGCLAGAHPLHRNVVTCDEFTPVPGPMS